MSINKNNVAQLRKGAANFSPNPQPQEWQVPTDNELGGACGLNRVGEVWMRPSDKRQAAAKHGHLTGALDLMRRLLALANDHDLQNAIAAAAGTPTHAMPSKRGLYYVEAGDLLDAVSSQSSARPDDRRLRDLADLFRRIGKNGGLRGDLTNSDQLELCSVLYVALELAQARNFASMQRGGLQCSFYQDKRLAAAFARAHMVRQARERFEQITAQRRRERLPEPPEKLAYEVERPSAMQALHEVWGAAQAQGKKVLDLKRSLPPLVPSGGHYQQNDLEPPTPALTAADLVWYKPETGDELFRQHSKHLAEGGQHKEFHAWLMAEHPDHAQNLYIDYGTSCAEQYLTFPEFVQLVRTGKIDRSWSHAQHVLNELGFEFFATALDWAQG